MFKNLQFLCLTGFLLFFLSVDVVEAGNPYINEFHYDNSGTDVNEFVEIAVPTGSSCSTLTLVLYNGNGGLSYKTCSVLDSTKVTVTGGDLYVLNISGIQNGDPDGMALVCDGTVLQFISYEGSFAAKDGPANGMTSVDIGVSEDGTNGPTTGSLEYNPTSATWVVVNPNSKGALNSGQTTLPILLKSFDGVLSGKTVKLTWTTTFERDHLQYEVQRSNDGKAFTSVGTVWSKGNSSKLTNYSFEDGRPFPGINYYRIKSVDMDGSVYYSQVINISNRLSNLLSIEHTQGEVTFSGIEKSGAVTIVDIVGNVIFKKTVNNQDNIDLSILPRGVLFCTLMEDGNYSIKKIINF